MIILGAVFGAMAGLATYYAATGGTPHGSPSYCAAIAGAAWIYAIACAISSGRGDD